MLLDFPRVADWLATDEPTVLALIEGGFLPQPELLADRLARWSEEALLRWADDGCPKSSPPTEAEFVRIRVLQVQEDVARQLTKETKR
jgi:predicted DNA-binding transcriptional regulator AlpA